MLNTFREGEENGAESSSNKIAIIEVPRDYGGCNRIWSERE